MGVVYLAQDTQLKRKVALKFAPSQYTDNSDHLRRFPQEAQTASSLNHPNIITIYEIGEEGGSHFNATEFIDGQTLRKHMKGTTLSRSEAVDIALQVASALSAAHGAGIILRDIKPDNLMVRHDGIVKVLDFGLAKLSDTEVPALVQFATEADALIGTPQYMSPEQARGEKLDAGTDAFSLGVVLYEMVAGRPPFQAVNSYDVISAILQKEPAPINRDVPEVPKELESIIAKALCKEPKQRYQSAE